MIASLLFSYDLKWCCTLFYCIKIFWHSMFSTWCFCSNFKNSKTYTHIQDIKMNSIITDLFLYFWVFFSWKVCQNSDFKLHLDFLWFWNLIQKKYDVYYNCYMLCLMSLHLVLMLFKVLNLHTALYLLLMISGKLAIPYHIIHLSKLSLGRSTGKLSINMQNFAQVGLKLHLVLEYGC